LRVSPSFFLFSQLFDATYQAPYFWNEKTGETSWDKPAAMSAPAPPVPKPAAARSGGGLISPVRARLYVM